VTLFAGDLLIIMAQIISAIQFVYEEKYIKQYHFHPLLVVGLEGLRHATHEFVVKCKKNYHKAPTASNVIFTTEKYAVLIMAALWNRADHSIFAL